MRNIFDQYNQPENRLTHALASCLNEDKRLLNQFVKWIGVQNFSGNLKIVAQQLPGDPEISEEESERRGLPDAWIYDEQSALLIESKISCSLTNDQLRRHYSTAIKRGFENVLVLAIDTNKPKRKFPEHSYFKKWTEIYTWIVNKQNYSDWAKRLKRYMEVAEAKLSYESYLREGTLTIFSGIPFSKEYDYSYLEAKRLLRLLMDELRKSKTLTKELNMDPALEGRGAITGKEGKSVWDFLRINESSQEEDFTRYPHLTLSIRSEELYVCVIIPNRIKTEFRKNLISMGEKQFNILFKEFYLNFTKFFNTVVGAVPWVEVHQRRYPSQRSLPIHDASLSFDLQTAFKTKGSKVEFQPQWLHGSWDAIANKKSNLQIAVGVAFPYDKCPIVKSTKVINAIVNSWICCKPIIKATVG